MASCMFGYCIRKALGLGAPAFLANRVHFFCNRLQTTRQEAVLAMHCGLHAASSWLMLSLFLMSLQQGARIAAAQSGGERELDRNGAGPEIARGAVLRKMRAVSTVQYAYKCCLIQRVF